MRVCGNGFLEHDFMKILKMALTQKQLVLLPVTTVIAIDFCFTIIIIVILLRKIVNLMKDVLILIPCLIFVTESCNNFADNT